MIAIIGAMDCEISLLLSAMTGVESEKTGKHTYYTGKIAGHDCVLVRPNDTFEFGFHILKSTFFLCSFFCFFLWFVLLFDFLFDLRISHISHSFHAARLFCLLV